MGVRAGHGDSREDGAGLGGARPALGSARRPGAGGWGCARRGRAPCTASLCCRERNASSCTPNSRVREGVWGFEKLTENE